MNILVNHLIVIPACLPEAKAKAGIRFFQCLIFIFNIILSANLFASELPNPRLHFHTGSDKLLPADQILLLKNVEWMKKNPNEVLVLEGHADERGTNSFNMELGDKRARAVKAALMKEGIDENRMIMIVSRGEDEPLDARHNPDAWRKNRRVEFIVR